MYRMSTGNASAQPMSQKVWRTLLNLEFSERGFSAGTSNNTNRNKLQQTAKEFLQSCLDATSLALTDYNDNATPVWNGRVIDHLNPLTDLEKEEIVWELTELNFRFELLGLDSLLSGKRSSESVVDRQQLVAACFFGCSGGSLLVADLDTANIGLGHTLWEGRAKYVLAMKRLMRDWSSIPRIIQRVNKCFYTERDILDLESAIAQFYTQAFYNHFHRAAIVPRRLSHHTSPTPIAVVGCSESSSNQEPNCFFCPLELQ
jgi:hypothetical protein